MTKRKDKEPRLVFVEAPLTPAEEAERVGLMQELGFDTHPWAGNRNWLHKFRLLKEFRDRIAALEGKG